MAAFETIEAQLQLTADSFQSGISNAVSSLDTLSSKSAGASKAVAGLGIGLGAVAAGGIAKSIGAAADLNASLTESQAIMGDLSSNEMQQMEDAAREVGKTTTFSASEAGDAFYYLASAGMDTQQSVAAVGDVAQFAQAGAFDLATATDLATDAQSALGLSADDAAENQENLNRVMDTLVGANQLANASVEEFSSALTNKAAAAMREAGIEIEEGTSALAVFADQGLKGQKAGTILARTIQGLQSAAQENTGAFERLGVAVYDADGNMRPMVDIVEDMEAGMEGMSTEQRNAAMAQLGLNERAAQGIGLMMGNSEKMREYEGELQNAGGAAEEVANNQLKSFNAQMDLLKSQVTDVGISIGNVLLPHLSTLVAGISTAVSWFADLNDKSDGLAGTFILLGGVLAGVAGAAVLLAPAILGVAGAFTVLLGPIGLVILAIAGLAAAWQADLFGIQQITRDVVAALTGYFDRVMEAVRAMVAVVKDLLAGDFAAAWQGIKDLVIGVITDVAAWLRSSALPAIKNAVIAIVTGAITAFGLFAEQVPPVVAAALDAATVYLQTQAVTDIKAAVSTVVTAAVEALRLLVTEGPGVVKDAISALVTFVGGIGMADVKGAFSTLAQGVVTVLKAWFGLNKAIGQVIVTLIGDLASWLVTSAGPRIFEAFKGLAQAAYDGLVDLKDRLVERVTESITAIYEYLTGIGARDIGAAIREIGLAVVAAARAIFEAGGDLYSVIEAGHQAIVDYLREDAKDDLVAALTAALDAVVEKVKEYFAAGKKIGSVIREFFAGLSEYIRSDAKGDLTAALGELWDAAVATAEAFAASLAPPDGVIRQMFADISDYIRDDAKADLADAIKAVFDAMYDVAHEFYLGLIGQSLIPDLFEEIAAYIAGKAKDLVVRAATGLVDAWLNIFEVFGVDVRSWLEGLTTDFLGDLSSFASDTLSEIGSLTSDALSAFTDFGRDVLGWLSGMTSDFLSAVNSFKSDVVGAFTSMASDALSTLKRKTSDFKSAGASLGSSFASGIKSKLGSVKRAASSIASKARSLLPGSDAEEGPLDDLTDIGPALTETLAEGMLRRLRELGRAAHQVAATARPEPTPPDPFGTSRPSYTNARARRGSDGTGGGDSPSAPTVLRIDAPDDALMRVDEFESLINEHLSERESRKLSERRANPR